MRRRQVWGQNPPAYVPTELEHINEAKLPDVAPRRREISAALSEPAVDISGRVEAHLVEKKEEKRPILKLPERKQRGRPPKNNQSA